MTISQKSVTLSYSRAGRCIYADKEIENLFIRLGFMSFDSIFDSGLGRDLPKSNMDSFRERRQFAITLPGHDNSTRVFLKRYVRPPVFKQLYNWLAHRRRGSFAMLEHYTASVLSQNGVRTPHTLACGEQWGFFFEKRSFLMIQEVCDSESLDQSLPSYFDGRATAANLRLRRKFIRRLGVFIRRFHETGYRHRDLYFSHIFYSKSGKFCLIDLARAFKPIRRERYRIKDIAQLHYSTPARYFSRTDRLRFYLAYAGRARLEPNDKLFIRKVVGKIKQILRHNRKQP